MVTGPMPRKPNATNPKANTGAAIMVAATLSPISLKKYATDMRATMVRPNQYAEKFPATKPDKIPSDAPPSFAEVTTSLTCRDSVEVNTFTNSGMMAPASVPQEMMVASFHHCVVSPPRFGTTTAEMTYVTATEISEVSHTSQVRGVSKFTLSAVPNRALAMAPL